MNTTIQSFQRIATDTNFRDADRVKVEGGDVHEANSSSFGRFFAMLTGARQKENRAAYDAFASALKDAYGDMGLKVLNNHRSEATRSQKLTKADISQVLAATAELQPQVESLKAKYGDGVLKAALRKIKLESGPINEGQFIHKLKNEIHQLTDVRRNRVVATQAESSWAVGTLRSMTRQQVSEMLDHLDQIADLLHKFGPRMLIKKPDFERIAGQPDNRVWQQLKKEVAAMRKDCSGTHFAEFTVKTTIFKNSIDFIGNIAAYLPGFKDFRMGVNEFDDRGRKEQESGRGSISDAHGGIVASEFRRNSVANFYSDEVVHAKGFFQRADKGTAEKFRSAGAPFIAGASGTIDFIARQIAYSQKSFEPNEDSEKLLGTYFATLVAGGHHSLSECLIASKGAGYFEDTPHPLNDYDGAMKALGARLEALGVSSGGKSMDSSMDT